MAVLLAGCAAPADLHSGPCRPGEPLLVGSSAVNMAAAPSPGWTVVWLDGRVERWVVRQGLEAGSAEDARVSARDGLDAEVVCGVATFHGRYPVWPPSGASSSAFHLEVDLDSTARIDPGPLEDLLRASFFGLPADASVPDCADGVTRRYSARLDGLEHHSQADCQGSAEFEAFAGSVHGLLADEA